MHLGPPLENNPEIPPSSRDEGLRLLHGLETNLAASLQTPQEASPAQIFDAPKRPKTLAFIRRQKYFHYEIMSRHVDLPEMQGKIMVFADKYGLGEKYSQRLQLCSEEIVFEMIEGCYGDENDIFIELEIIYTESERILELNLSCGGKNYNPFAKKDSEDDLSLKILYGYGKNFRYSSSEGLNKVSMEITPP